MTAATNALRLRGNFLSGTITDNPLTSGATTINSANFANLPVIDSAHHMALTLDPNATSGSPEVVWITAHTASATSVTVLRAQEGTLARSFAVLSAWTNSPTKLDFTLPYLGDFGINDRIWQPGAAANALNDEFNDGSLDAAWVRVDNPSSAHLTWTEGADCLTAYHTGTDSAAGYHALLKPISGGTFAIGNSWDVCLSYCGPTQASPMAGGMLTDGTASGSGAQIVGAYWQQGGSTGPASGLRRATGFNTDASNSGNVTLGGGDRYRVHLRTTWVAANSFRSYISPNGAVWLPLEANQAYTCTPTYVGFFVTSWGSTSDFMYSFEYGRVS
jgi:hypothetical protein